MYARAHQPDSVQLFGSLLFFFIWLVVSVWIAVYGQSSHGFCLHRLTQTAQILARLKTFVDCLFCLYLSLAELNIRVCVWVQCCLRLINHHCATPHKHTNILVSPRPIHLRFSTYTTQQEQEIRSANTQPKKKHHRKKRKQQQFLTEFTTHKPTNLFHFHPYISLAVMLSQSCCCTLKKVHVHAVAAAAVYLYTLYYNIARRVRFISYSDTLFGGAYTPRVKANLVRLFSVRESVPQASTHRLLVLLSSDLCAFLLL